MPGLGNILLALTGGAVAGYGNQIAQQRNQKTAFVLKTLMEYPEAASDPDFSKLAVAAGLPKDSIAVIGQVAAKRQALMNQQTQQAMGLFENTAGQGSGQPGGQPGGGMSPPPPGLPGSAVPSLPRSLPTGPGSAATPGFLAATAGRTAQPSSPVPPGAAGGQGVPGLLAAGGMAGGQPTPPAGFQIPAPPPLRRPTPSMTIVPGKGVRTSVSMQNLGADEGDQRSLQLLNQLVTTNPGVPPQEIISQMRNRGWPLKTSTEQNYLEQVGMEALTRLNRGGTPSSDALKQNIRTVLASGLPVPPAALQAAGMTTAEEDVNKAVATERGTLPFKKQMAEFQQQVEQLYNSTSFTDPGTGQTMTLTPPLQKVARPIVDDFRQDMKAGPDAAKLAYNNIVGFLQDPHGLPQMDLVISYIRLAGGGRLNQAQIDQDLKSGTSAGGMLRKWTNIYLKGDVIGPEQMEQIRNSSYHLYQQTLAQEYQLRQNAIRQLQANGVPAAILPEGTRVIDPQTNKPIEWEGAPDTPAQGAPPAGEDWSGPTPSGPAASPAAPATRMTKPPTAAPDDWAEAIQRGLVK